MKAIPNTLPALVGAAFLLGAGLPPAEASDKPAAALSAEASSALANAAFLVDLAKSKKSLWTTAASALEQAQEAARKNDSGAVIAHATAASEQASLGMAQADYPLTRVD